MSRLAEGVQVVGRMVALREDGSPVAVAWIVFDGEDENSAEAFELVREVHGQIRLVPLALGKLADWRRVAALVAEKEV